MQHFWINAVGYVGSFFLILAFLLNSIKKLDSGSVAYQMMNLFGAALLLVNAAFFGAIPSAIVSLFWVLVSVFCLGKMFLDRKKLNAINHTL